MSKERRFAQENSKILKRSDSMWLTGSCLVSRVLKSVLRLVFWAVDYPESHSSWQWITQNVIHLGDCWRNSVIMAIVGEILSSLLAQFCHRGYNCWRIFCHLDDCWRNSVILVISEQFAAIVRRVAECWKYFTRNTEQIATNIIVKDGKPSNYRNKLCTF